MGPLIVGCASQTQLVLVPNPGVSCPSATSIDNNVAMPDASGLLRQPLKLDDSTAAVFLFVATDCPISNGYAPEFNRICAKYSAATGTFERKTNFYVVYTDSEMTVDAAKTHARNFGYTCPALLDTHGRLSTMLGVRVTPESAIVDRDGRVLYRGRIDDTWIALGRSRLQPTTRDLRDAIDAVLDSKPISHSRTDAVGCSIAPG